MSQNLIWLKNNVIAFTRSTNQNKVMETNFIELYFLQNSLIFARSGIYPHSVPVNTLYLLVKNKTCGELMESTI
jgi:hypothetical protein